MSTTSTERPFGVRASGGVLDLIVAEKVKRIEEAKRRVPVESLVMAGARHALSFADALNKKASVNVIAEIKRRSPSKGIIREDFDPVWIAESYADGGAAALSVLCEEDFFGGSLEHLAAIRKSVDLPLLRKDFIFDEYQLHESALAGADAVLLIVAILEDELLERLIGLAKDLGLDALVEVHSKDEVGRAVQAGASIIGVNNRDLTTFKVDLETSLELAPLTPEEAILVSESGIGSWSDILKLKASGFNAFLIGEHLMRAEHPGAALKTLIAKGAASLNK